jgi:hypothetical protein
VLRRDLRVKRAWVVTTTRSARLLRRRLLACWRSPTFEKAIVHIRALAVAAVFSSPIRRPSSDWMCRMSATETPRSGACLRCLQCRSDTLVWRSRCVRHPCGFGSLAATLTGQNVSHVFSRRSRAHARRSTSAPHWTKTPPGAARALSLSLAHGARQYAALLGARVTAGIYCLFAPEVTAPKLPVSHFWAIPLVLLPPWWRATVRAVTRG